MKPLIGLPAQRYETVKWKPPFHGQRESYVEAIVAAGGIPAIVPLITQPDVLRDFYDRLDGILLCGGQDISPQWYGGSETGPEDPIDPRHDHVELQLMRWAWAENKPLLAICRGMQILNIAQGGTLIPDIPTHHPTKVDHRLGNTLQDPTYLGHELILEPDSRLATLLNTTHAKVNSLHHQAIDRLGRKLRVVGRSEDGIIEAIEATEDHGFLIGVQYHPELLIADPLWLGLFQHFVQASSKALTSSLELR